MKTGAFKAPRPPMHFRAAAEGRRSFDLDPPMAALEELRQRAEAWTAGVLANHTIDPSRQPALAIRTFTKVRTVEAAVSPDCSWSLIKAAIEKSRRDICLYIYNASAEHVVELLRSAKRRGVSVRVMYDLTDTRGNERAKLEALGVELKTAPSTGGRRVFTVCHQKFAVIDENVLLLGSANWANSAIPLVTPGGYKKGNREWIVRIENISLARWFKKLFEADWSIPEGPQPPADLAIKEAPSPVLFAPRPPGRPQEVFPSQLFNFSSPVRVTPAISPDNYTRLITKLVREAKNSIDIEQQYILAGGPATEGLLSALRARKQDLRIRIIVSPAFRKVGSDDNWEISMATLQAFDLKDCLRGMDLKFYTHLHNKGVIVDREKVLVSSTNWSENSFARAREAGVLIESPPVASYFASVFDFDWKIARKTAELPANIVWLPSESPPQPEATSIHSADMA